MVFSLTFFAQYLPAISTCSQVVSKSHESSVAPRGLHKTLLAGTWTDIALHLMMPVLWLTVMISFIVHGGWLTGWLVGWLIDCKAGWLVAGWLAGWQADWLADWLAARLLPDRLAGWLTAWLLAGWLGGPIKKCPWNIKLFVTICMNTSYELYLTCTDNTYDAFPRCIKVS